MKHLTTLPSAFLNSRAAVPAYFLRGPRRRGLVLNGRGSADIVNSESAKLASDNIVVATLSSDSLGLGGSQRVHSIESFSRSFSTIGTLHGSAEDVRLPTCCERSTRRVETVRCRMTPEIRPARLGRHCRELACSDCPSVDKRRVHATQFPARCHSHLMPRNFTKFLHASCLSYVLYAFDHSPFVARWFACIASHRIASRRIASVCMCDALRLDHANWACIVRLPQSG